MSAPVSPVEPLPPEKLITRFSPADVPFETTAEVEPATPEIAGMVGQDRALEAIDLAVGIRRQGYNLFALGPSGMGKHTLIRQILEDRSRAEPVPADWVYVHDFEDTLRPRCLRLPNGRGRELKDAADAVVDELQTTIPTTFEGEEFRTRAEGVARALEEKREAALRELRERCSARDIRLVQTPEGFVFAPTRDGEVIPAEVFEALAEDEKKAIGETIVEFQMELQEALRAAPRWQRASQEELTAVSREFVRLCVEQAMIEIREQFAEIKEVTAYLAAFAADVEAHFEDFQGGADLDEDALFPALTRYAVHPVICHPAEDGAPVVFEDNPTFHNLMGRIDHIAHRGTLTTNFTLIRPGALARANGGYLLLDARKVLTQPFAWASLKRAIHSQEIHVDSFGEWVNPSSAVTLEPEPIPLDLKVILLGDRSVYYTLESWDPDFQKLFKLAADFEERGDRRDAEAYARMIARLQHDEELLPLDREAVARLVDHASRLAGDSEKLQIHAGRLRDLLVLTDFQASEAGREVVTREDVEEALASRLRMASRVRERMRESIRRGSVMIECDGAKVGQINGLSVYMVGGQAFGQPARITATHRIGGGEVIDIEREAKLGGNLHSKGVLILSGYLGSTYARHTQLSLSARLVFEQSYGSIDGDSASLAELLALLSSLSGLPLRQDIGVTGSVDQHGQVQPIGGVNHKIEGFFAVCRDAGLTGRQGVVIPATNVKNLMLDADVVEAVRAGRFSVWAVSSVVEAISVLFDQAPGQRDRRGHFPKDTVNRRVESRLVQLANYKQKKAPRKAPSKPKVAQDGKKDEPAEPGDDEKST